MISSLPEELANCSKLTKMDIEVLRATPRICHGSIICSHSPHMSVKISNSGCHGDHLFGREISL